MESEKVKEIKKGLECCSFLMDNNAPSEERDNSCNECPYRLNDRCSWNLDKDALTLINELESENERLLEQRNKTYNIWVKDTEKLKDRIALLEKDNELLRNAKVVYETVDYCYKDLKKAEKRIAELEKENEVKTDTIIDLLKKQEFYEKEKLKQFAERLKEKAYQSTDWSHGEHPMAVEVDYIDETLEEFIGE